MEVLFERTGLPAFPLPPRLAERYGGDLGFRRPCLFANFVASADGVVSLGGGGESGRFVSGDNEPDHFLMGLLRACADAVLVGAGTFRSTRAYLWHPQTVCAAAAESFRELRSRLGLRPQPRLVLLTASGQIDTRHPALADALIVTTPAGQARLSGGLSPGSELRILEPASARLEPVLGELRAEGMELVLTEGGPLLLGRLLAEELVDELFLTLSPKLFGRYPADGRKSLVDGFDLAGEPLELLSARRHESHLFLRYGRRR